jgi:hypothetical protein
MSELPQKSGSVKYSRIELTSHTGDVADIQHITQQVDLYEDLFANHLSGSITILDATGFSSMFPVIGQETLLMQYRVVGADLKELRLAVYKVERVQSTQNADLVKMHFVSQEAYIGLTTVISKSFKGSAASIVKTVFDDYIGTGKPMNIENSKFPINVIAPKWNPFYFINWLAGRAIPADGKTPSFFFYETISGFNFVSLESKFKTPSKGVWRKQLPNASQSANSPDFDKLSYNTTTIHSYELLEAFDFITSQLHGMIGSEMYVVDSLSNGYRKITFDYLEEFKKSKHLNESPISVRTTSFGHTFNSPGITRIAHDSSRAFTGLDTANKYEEWVLPRISFMQQLNGQRLQIEVAGNGVVEVGDVVTIFIPLVASSETLEPRPDPILSGNYIITAIHHVMGLTTHEMIVELCKESTITIPKVDRK